eukprot:GHVT01034135.1.p2 GENE.GHVT01034135.1~~GHVT01034135.1.p2  ORF type:complete len:118 (+),score=11.68 GHVT01034135.1:118-471(+)
MKLLREQFIQPSDIQKPTLAFSVRAFSKATAPHTHTTDTPTPNAATHTTHTPTANAATHSTDTPTPNAATHTTDISIATHTTDTSTATVALTAPVRATVAPGATVGLVFVRSCFISF